MPPLTQANLYCSSDDVETLLSSLGVDVRQDDDDDGSPDSVGGIPIIDQALNWGTAQVKFYCATRYDDSELVKSWLVNSWATILAAVFLCSRRLNSIPNSVHMLAYGDREGGAFQRGVHGNQGVMGDLRAVRAGAAQIPDINLRNEDTPAF